MKRKRTKKTFLLIRFFSPICIISSDYTKSALVHFQTIDRTFHYYNLVSVVLIADFSVLCNTHCKQIRENNLCGYKPNAFCCAEKNFAQFYLYFKASMRR